MKEKKEKKENVIKRLLAEFKTFINRGNVMDLAVGMIIGSAFTAVVTSLVNNILTPLINWNPGTGETGALQTVLREAVVDSAGQVVTEAVIINWGAVISAIVTFLLTALVLFAIVKAFNKIKEMGTAVTDDMKELAEKMVDSIKNASDSSDSEEVEEVVKAVAEEPVVEEKDPAPAAPTTEELLMEIISLLKEKN